MTPEAANCVQDAGSFGLRAAVERKGDVPKVCGSGAPLAPRGLDVDVEVAWPDATDVLDDALGVVDARRPAPDASAAAFALSGDVIAPDPVRRGCAHAIIGRAPGRWFPKRTNRLRNTRNSRV